MSAVRVLVFGASGFVGSAVAGELRQLGAQVVASTAPRLRAMPPESAEQAVADAALVGELSAQMEGFDAVVNCAGNPDASLTDIDALTAVNGVLPGVLAAAASRSARQPRYVHVSSAVVQGRQKELDATPATEGFSAYSRSKALGERLALEHGPAGQTVVYRPPSVHAPDRRVTRMISAIARSPMAVVSAPRTSPSPQALLRNVAAAVAFLATTEDAPPPIVTHPSEGLTTASLMELLGGKPPRVIPRTLAWAIVGTLTVVGRAIPRVAPNARRVEMLLFGQAQAPSWLTRAGWRPPSGADGWRELGVTMATQSDDSGEGPHE